MSGPVMEDDVMVSDRAIMRAGRAIFDYLAGQDDPVSLNDLYAAVRKIARCHEGTVNTAISRIADHLEWDYSTGPVRFSLKR